MIEVVHIILLAHIDMRLMFWVIFAIWLLGWVSIIICEYWLCGYCFQLWQYPCYFSQCVWVCLILYLQQLQKNSMRDVLYSCGFFNNTFPFPFPIPHPLPLPLPILRRLPLPLFFPLPILSCLPFPLSNAILTSVSCSLSHHPAGSTHSHYYHCDCHRQEGSYPSSALNEAHSSQHRHPHRVTYLNSVV